MAHAARGEEQARVDACLLGRLRSCRTRTRTTTPGTRGCPQTAWRAGGTSSRLFAHLPTPTSEGARTASAGAKRQLAVCSSAEGKGFRARVCVAAYTLFELQPGITQWVALLHRMGPPAHVALSMTNSSPHVAPWSMDTRTTPSETGPAGWARVDTVRAVSGQREAADRCWWADYHIGASVVPAPVPAPRLLPRTPHDTARGARSRDERGSPSSRAPASGKRRQRRQHTDLWRRRRLGTR